MIIIRPARPKPVMPVATSPSLPFSPAAVQFKAFMASLISTIFGAITISPPTAVRAAPPNAAKFMIMD